MGWITVVIGLGMLAILAMSGMFWIDEGFESGAKGTREKPIPEGTSSSCIITGPRPPNLPLGQASPPGTVCSNTCDVCYRQSSPGNYMIAIKQY